MSWFLASVFLGMEQAAVVTAAAKWAEAEEPSQTREFWVRAILAVEWIVVAIVIGNTYFGMWKAKSEKDEPISKDKLERRNSATNRKASQEGRRLESRLESHRKASQERYKQVDEVYCKQKLVFEYQQSVSSSTDMHSAALRERCLSLRALFRPDLAEVAPKTEHTQPERFASSSKLRREDFHEEMLEALFEFLDSALGTSSPKLLGVRREDFDEERLSLLFERLDGALETKPPQAESLSSLKSYLESICGASQETKPQSAASSSKLNLNDLSASSLELSLQKRERHADVSKVE